MSNRILSLIFAFLGLSLISSACNIRRAKSQLSRAVHNDTSTSLLKIPGISGRDELLLKTTDYQTPQRQVLGFRIVCSVPRELDALLSGMGFDPRIVPQLPLAYSYDAVDNPPPAIAALDWLNNPEIRCPSDQAAGDKVALRRSQDDDKTLFYLQVTESSNSARMRNLFELGCKGLTEGMGLSLAQAEIIDSRSFVQGSQGRIIDINCQAGQVADLIPFVVNCEKAFAADDRTLDDESYVELFRHMENDGFTGSTCSDLWKHMKGSTSVGINGLRITSLAPLRYLTKTEKLLARDNFITDLSPLAGLVRLQELDLGQNSDLEDLSPLQNLKNLGTLRVDETSVSNLNPLASLSKMRVIDVSQSLVNIPDLDALKNLRLTELKMDGLNLVWTASRQTFFTNCHMLKLLPAAERASFSRILQAYGIGVNDQFVPTLSCFNIYKDLTNAQKWPSIDLSNYMKYELGTDPNRVTACLKTSALTTLNELPARVNLDYEGCPLTHGDLTEIARLKRLRYLDLRGTGISDLIAFRGLAGLEQVELELEGLNINWQKCPTDTNNRTLTSYCMRYQLAAFQALKPLHYLASSFANVELTNVTSDRLPNIQVKLLSNTCPWVQVNALGQTSGIWPHGVERCQLKVAGAYENQQSPDLSIELVRGTPRMTSIVPASLWPELKNVPLVNLTSPDSAAPATVKRVGGSCGTWLTIDTAGRAAGIWKDASYSCTVELEASSLYGTSEKLAITLKRLDMHMQRVDGNWKQCAITPDGKVKCWYWSKFLGTWENLPEALQISAKDYRACALFVDKTVYCSKNEETPRKVPGFEGAIYIAVGDDHRCAVRDDGKVLCQGANDFGQLGYDSQLTPSAETPVAVPQLDKVLAVAAGDKHSCALKQDGSVWCWGENSVGQLGTGDTRSSIVPRKVLLSKKAMAISAGFLQTCAIMEDRTLECWGNNTSYEAGAPDRVAPVKTPVKVRDLQNLAFVNAGKTATCAVTMDYQAYCWGSNELGQSGSNITSSMLEKPTKVSPPLGEALSVTGGDVYGCAIDLQGRFYCWGNSFKYASPLVSRIPVLMPDF